VWIGGDFMNGRVLTAPLCAAVVAGVEVAPGSNRRLGLVVVVAAIIGSLATRPTWTSTQDTLPSKREAKDSRGIADEQAFWSHDASLTLALRGVDVPRSKFRRRGESEPPGAVVRAGSIGFLGYYADPTVYFFDRFALADPLLARLPAQRRLRWRPGHFARAIPEGYPESLEADANLLADRRLRPLYDDIRLVTRARLFEPERLAAIWRLNTGHHRGAVKQDRYRYWGQEVVRLATMLPAEWSPGGESAAAPAQVEFGESGVMVRLGRLVHEEVIVLELSGGADYLVRFQDGAAVHATVTIDAPRTRGLELHVIEPPGAAARRGYDRVVVLPLSGRRWALGAVALR
jgi:arabinofuranosyltransferase